MILTSSLSLIEVIRNRQFVSNLRPFVIKNLLFSKNILLKYINKNNNDAIFFLYLRDIIYTQLKNRSK